MTTETAAPSERAASLAHTEDWRLRSACLDEDGDLFFPVGDRRAAQAQFEEARAFCGRCSVSTRCLLFALEVGAEFGMWGGTTPGERQRVARRAEDLERRRRHARFSAVGYVAVVHSQIR